ncbi:hypothetical protein LEP3755_24070 [Leptolyngbya sp. NIES-3755]|nr:hypothetical protein LEP3755_24070 [Leptolyngbya sp. NIES-3755]
MNRVSIAQNTLEILEAGHYTAPSGTQVNITAEIRDCVDRTLYYDPETLSNIQQEILSSPAQCSTSLEVKRETTLEGIQRLAGKFQKIGALNFASATNPGGGFLNGAQAQEESLARSSALYKSLLKGREYYDYHRANRSTFYSDRMIYSPNCPVFKDDNGNLLDQPYFVDFITSPAPNAGMIAKDRSNDVDKIEETLRVRGSKVLSLAVHQNCDALILGAWGCGVFRNSPVMVAQMFADLLKGDFQGRFRFVSFSIYDSSKNQSVFSAFNQQFESVA